VRPDRAYHLSVGIRLGLVVLGVVLGSAVIGFRARRLRAEGMPLIVPEAPLSVVISGVTFFGAGGVFIVAFGFTHPLGIVEATGLVFGPVGFVFASVAVALTWGSR
jgi:hypothetical protein